jgi:methylated-DNA-[protein]-cysteine S-methyltransferase
MLRWTEIVLDGDLRLRLVASPAGVRAVEFQPVLRVEGVPDDRDPVLAELARELRAYFAAGLRRFEVPLDIQGTDFQKRVWRELLTIPFGETRSYQQIATAIGAESAVRAVGAANGANPIAIVVPCHRVIGTNGKLTGYGGGLPLKRRLLELEGAWTAELRY